MSARPGLAMAIVLMVLLLIEIMAAGMIALAGQARLIAAGQMRTARAEARALAGARRVLADWDSIRHDTMPLLELVAEPGGSGRLGDAAWVTTVERLSSSTFVVRSHADVGADVAASRARVTAVARSLDRLAALATLNVAAASGGPAVLAGSATVSAAEHLPPGWTLAACGVPAEGALPAAALLTARPALIGPDVRIHGGTTVDTTAFPADSVAIGGVRWGQIEAIADQIVGGTVTPAPPPTPEGPCDRAVFANWGDPDRPNSPCGGFFPLIFAPGDLHVSGGRGQGILVVTGILTLEAGARFVGAIVAGGGVAIADDVTIVGAVRATGGPAIFSGSALHFSRCAIGAALHRSPGARRLILHDRTFIPPF